MLQLISVSGIHIRFLICLNWELKTSCSLAAIFQHRVWNNPSLLSARWQRDLHFRGTAETLSASVLLPQELLPDSSSAEVHVPSLAASEVLCCCLVF